MGRRTAAVAMAICVCAGGGSAVFGQEESKMDVTKGITFSSGHNSLTIGARVQFRSTWDDREEFDADTAGTGDGREDGVAGDFDIPRMRVTLKGGFWKPWLTYEFQYEFSRTNLLEGRVTGIGTPNDEGGVDVSGTATGTNSRIKDAVLELHGSPLAIVKLGQFKTPFSLQQLTSSGRQQFVDRAITDAKFVPGRDVGVALTGTTESRRFGYSVGGFNGAGEGARQEDDGFLWVGRLWFDPLGEYKLAESAAEAKDDTQELHVGLSARTGEVSKGTATSGVFEDPNDETAVGVEAAWRSGRLFAAAEYFVMSNELANPGAGADVDSNGFYVQAGFMPLPQKLELGLRHARIEADEDADAADVTETRAVVGWFFRGHNLKLQADAGQVEWERGFASLPSIARRGMPALSNRLVSDQDLTDRQVRIQLQLAF